MSSRIINQIKCDGVVIEEGLKPNIHCPRIVASKQSIEEIRKTLKKNNWNRDEKNDKDYCPNCVNNMEWTKLMENNNNG